MNLSQKLLKKIYEFQDKDNKPLKEISYYLTGWLNKQAPSMGIGEGGLRIDFMDDRTDHMTELLQKIPFRMKKEFIYLLRSCTGRKIGNVFTYTFKGYNRNSVWRYHRNEWNNPMYKEAMKGDILKEIGE